MPRSTETAEFQAIFHIEMSLYPFAIGIVIVLVIWGRIFKNVDRRTAGTMKVFQLVLLVVLLGGGCCRETNQGTPGNAARNADGQSD